MSLLLLLSFLNFIFSKQYIDDGNKKLFKCIQGIYSLNPTGLTGNPQFLYLRLVQIIPCILATKVSWALKS